MFLHGEALSKYKVPANKGVESSSLRGKILAQMLCYQIAAHASQWRTLGREVWAAGGARS